MRIFNLIATGLLFSFLLQSQPAQTDRIPGRLIVHHAAGVSGAQATSLISRHGARLRRRMEKLNLSVIEVPAGSEEAIMQSLRASGQVTEVEYDHYAKLAATANDPYLTSQWYLTKIQATSAWGVSVGSGTPIAVLDTGVDATHPDLAGRVMTGWNFVSNTNNTQDTMGHGTAVAGVFGAISNNGVGVSGITWTNPVLPLVVVDSTNYASYSNIAAAIEYAADHGAKVINVSIGGTSPSSALQAAVDYAWNAGAIVVAAAMNNSSSTPNYPAACNNAVAVAATDENDNLASFSDFGSWITVSAPGNNIETTMVGGGYGLWWGTSLATPVVSGVAALALAANPSLTPQALVTLLKNNADDLGSPGFDNVFGWGRVNAYRTVVAAQSGSTTPPVTTTPTTPTAPVTTAPVTSAPVLSGVPMYINAGGGAFTDASGQTWSADSGFSGGSTWAVGAPIANGGAQALYSTCRYGVFSYNLNVPNGNYTVTLKFAEITAYGAGQRQFNVAINGSTVLSNFDIYANAGGMFIPIDRAFPVTVTNGQISIQFLNGALNWPLVSGIQVGTGSAPVSTPNSAAAIRVNAGGGAYTDSAGQSWSADTGYTGGALWAVGAAIANTTAQPLYQTCRWGAFGYNFAVPNGTYTVTLRFAEVSAYGPGQRMFNAAINGSAVLANFDIYANAGGMFIPIDKSFPVSVSNGQISIQFTYGAANAPMVNAIQIVQGASGQATSTLPTMRINSGGPAYTDSTGQTWATDNSYYGGAIWAVAANIANTNDPTLYQTCRYGVFTYIATVPNGNYTVTLKFAETGIYGVGQRTFNVALNGAEALTNFDVFAAAGGMYTAVDRSFPLTVTNGLISIQFTNGTASSPMVNAIQVVPAN